MDGFFKINEVTEQYIMGCDAKIKAPFLKTLIKAVMAGAMVAFGAANSSVAAHTISDVGLSRLVAGVVFPVGLMMIVLLGAELFTGNCLASMSVFDGKQKFSKYSELLIIVYIGNFIGALLIALAVFYSGQLDFSSGMLGAYTIKVAAAKASIPFAQAVVSGILCNALVCVAVLMAMCAKDIAGKLLVVFFVIMLFVVGGFEHCVANMYYITAGLFASARPEYTELAVSAYGISKEALASLNITGFLIKNLLPVTIGNIIGGVLFVGAPVYYLNRKK